MAAMTEHPNTQPNTKPNAERSAEHFQTPWVFGPNTSPNGKPNTRTLARVSEHLAEHLNEHSGEHPNAEHPNTRTGRCSANRTPEHPDPNTRTPTRTPEHPDPNTRTLARTLTCSAEHPDPNTRTPEHRAPNTQPNTSSESRVRWLRRARTLMLTGVVALPPAVNAQNIVEWAQSPNGLNLSYTWAWLVFAGLDLTALVCVLETLIQAERGRKAGAFALLVWAFAAASAYAGYRHGTQPSAGRDIKWFFPFLSIAGPAILHLILKRSRLDKQVNEGKRLTYAPASAYGWKRWVPLVGALGETFCAWRVGHLEGITRPAVAIERYRELRPNTGRLGLRVLRSLRIETEHHQMRNRTPEHPEPNTYPNTYPNTRTLEAEHRTPEQSNTRTPEHLNEHSGEHLPEHPNTLTRTPEHLIFLPNTLTRTPEHLPEHPNTQANVKANTRTLDLSTERLPEHPDPNTRTPEHPETVRSNTQPNTQPNTRTVSNDVDANVQRIKIEWPDWAEETPGARKIAKCLGVSPSTGLSYRNRLIAELNANRK